MMRFTGLLLSVLLLLCGLPAAAQDSGEGLLNAVSYRAIPAGVAVVVRTLDNSEDNMVLKEEFERQLRGRGYRVAEEADFVLTFDLREVAGAYSDPDSRFVIEFQGHNVIGNDESARARVNIFDSDRGGLINEGRGGETGVVTPSQHRLDVTIENRTERRRHWEGWAVANITQTDRLDVARAMVPALTDHLGQTVRRQTIPLP